MGISAAVFESAGQRSEHLVPGVYSRSNNISGTGSVSAGNVVILGKSAGGEPHRLLEFGNISDAKDTLVSGELLEGVAQAFQPSADYRPSRVYAMRVNPGTRSGIKMTGNSSESLLEIKSWDWGVHTNQLKMKYESGTDGAKLSIVYKDNTFEYDRLGRNCISVALNTDDDTVKTVSVESALQSLKVTAWGERETVRYETYTAEDPLDVPEEAVEDEEGRKYTEIPGEDGEGTLYQYKLEIRETEKVEAGKVEISYSDFSTLSDVVNRLNDIPYLTASLLYSEEGAKAEEMDTGSFELGGFDGPEITLTGNCQAVIDALERCPYIGEVTLSGSGRISPDYIEGYQYFTGGTEGEYSVSTFMTALEKLSAEDVQIIATPSSAGEIHSLIKSHCADMSSVHERKERTFFAGCEEGLPVDDIVAKAKAFNTKYGSLVCDGYTAVSPVSGEVRSYPPGYLACKLAGLEAALRVGEPLTNKDLDVLSFSVKRKRTEQERLISGGVLVCNETQDGRLAVIRSLTTYQKDSLMDCERSMVREDFYMNRDLRNRFAPSIGRVNDVSTDSAVAVLKAAAKDWLSNGLIVAGNGGEGVFDIAVSVDGDKLYLTFSRYLAAPRNFVFVTANNYTYSTTTVSV